MTSRVILALLATITWSPAIRCPAQEPKERRTLRHGGGVLAVALSPDGRLFASGGSGGVFRLWGVGTGEERAAHKADRQAITSVAFSPDGRAVASAGVDKAVRLWEVASGKERATLKGHT